MKIKGGAWCNPVTQCILADTAQAALAMQQNLALRRPKASFEEWEKETKYLK